MVAEVCVAPLFVNSKYKSGLLVQPTKGKLGSSISPHQLLPVVETLTDDKRCAYFFVLNRGQNYNISYEAKGYLFHSENINVPKVAEYSDMRKDVVLDRVEAGAKVVLNNIFFDSNKSTLRKESKVEIDKLIALMKEYPEVVIEVSGHTDNKGNDAANMTLSQARSQAVVNALIKKGANKQNLIAKGYGETAPIAPNTLPNGKPDVKGMQQNRRVEMKIVKIEYLSVFDN